MTRLTIDDLAGDMPEQAIIAALASANARAEAIFGGAVPQQYAPAADYAVRVFLLDLLFRRHGDGEEKNPWAKLAEAQEARLRALAAGTEAIDASSDGIVISKPARIYNSEGVMS